MFFQASIETQNSPILSVKLHLFNPENDLALGLGCRNYTPPPHAAAIHHAGALLPLWWAEEEDRILAPAPMAPDAERLRDSFGLYGKIYDGNAERIEAAPWGWSLDAKRQFLNAGVDGRFLPSDSHIGRLRDLSHRRMSIRILQELGADYPLPVETADAATAVELERLNPGCFIKSPWSGSGRGVFCARSLDENALRKRAEGIIHRQGSVMIERGLDKRLDFAALFHAGNGRVVFKGWSVFKAEARGMYSGNIVAPQDMLKAIISKFIASETLDAVAARLETILTGLLGTDYEGWLGIDMMAYCENGLMKLMPCVELNLRMTMGVAAMKICERLSVRDIRLLAWHHGRKTEICGNATILLPPTDGFTLSLTPVSDSL